MCRLFVLCALLFCLSVSTTFAQPAETVLIDSTLVMYPGETQSKCVDVERGVLMVVASSPPGRAGEDARLGFRPNRQTTYPDAFLSVVLSLEEVSARHYVEAGSYCYWVTVSSRVPDTSDPNRPDRPNKQARIKVTHEASP